MFGQGLKKKYSSIGLMLFGIISLLFSLYNSVLTIAGIGATSLVIGGILFIKSARTKLSRENILKTILLFAGIAIFSFGCTIKVPMAPNVGKIEIKKIIPLEAGLLITEETRNYVFRGNPESFTGSARPHEFPLGEALEKASVQTFSQVFQKVTLVRTPLATKNYKIVVEPKIEEFHFRYNQLSYAGFAIAVISKIKVRVTLASGKTKIWEKSVESPEQKKGPWVVNFSYKKDVGESASEALTFSLRKIAMEIAEDASVKQFIERQ
jgi:hypothetical protein